MARKVAKFYELAVIEKRLFLEALFIHLWIGVLLKVIPFRWIPRLFRSPQFEALSQEETQTLHAVSGRQAAVLERLREAIGRAGAVSPWKNRCLISSLAGRCMLRRRKIGSSLSLGLLKGKNGTMIAHAWLKAGDFEVVERSGDYYVLYLF